MVAEAEGVVIVTLGSVEEICRKKDSAGSAIKAPAASAMIGTDMVAVVSPGAKVTDPP